LIALSEEQQKILSAEGNLLVLGGPGSGKTTVAILKAGIIVREYLRPAQKVIFLSFARPTVARIFEALDRFEGIAKEDKRSIEIDTYHAFFWRVIRSHGYLIGLPRAVSLLSPAEEAIALSSLRNQYPAESKLTDELRQERFSREREERVRLAFQEGKICLPVLRDRFSTEAKRSRN
jgi:DNA helicase-2/ATP-dependent DNA helicase PcrA